MQFTFSETSSVRHLQKTVDIFSYSLASGQTAVIWATHHPYGAVAIATLSLILFKMILDLAADVLRQGLQGLLKSPFKLAKWGILSSWQSTRQVLGKTPPVSVDEKIKTILSRLDALRQEQDILIQELKTLLVSK